MWNRYFGPNAMDVTGKNFLKTAQNVKNFTTMWQLLGGGYHMVAETTEAMTGDVMRAISQLAAGRFSEAGSRLAGAPLAPYRQYSSSAAKALEAYYTPEKATPEVRDAVNYLVKAGFTPNRVARYTPDVNSAAHGFFDGWLKGANSLQMQELGQQAMKGPKGAATSAFQLAGKSMQTLMEPLFNHYIPNLKTGAALEQMADYMAANKDNPERFQQAAKMILKSTDDRLGEMNQSTLFWNNTLKKAANLLMISPGWETGTLRAGMGGAGSFLKGAAEGRPLSRLSITSPDFKPNASWPFAFAIMTAATSSIYQYLKTGKVPESGKDLWAPQTGGTALNSAQPERAIPPGYVKDVYSWWHGLTGSEGLPRNAANMLYGKLSMVPRTTWDTMANSDWEGKRLYNPSDPLQQRMQEYLHSVWRESRPIIAQQVAKTGVKGSNITRPEAAFGIRAASKAVADPAQSEAGIAKGNKKAWDEALAAHKRLGD